MGRAMSRLPENGLKSNNPRGYQGGQEWLWWALTPRGDTIASGKCRFYLEVAAGIFVDSSRVVDGNLVSGHTYRDNGHFVGPWIRLLEEAAARVVA